MTALDKKIKERMRSGGLNDRPINKYFFAINDPVLRILQEAYDREIVATHTLFQISGLSPANFRKRMKSFIELELFDGRGAGFVRITERGKKVWEALSWMLDK